MIKSFSAKGHPYDNAVMNCFFKYLKREETNRRSYSSIDKLKIIFWEPIHSMTYFIPLLATVDVINNEFVVAYQQ